MGAGNPVSLDWSDEQISAWLDEAISASHAVQMERQVREDSSFRHRVEELMRTRNQGEVTLGDVWRRERLSCPQRTTWLSFRDGRLGDGYSNYLKFHLEVVQCPFCVANFADLATQADLQVAERSKRFFETSAGHLPRVKARSE